MNTSTWNLELGTWNFRRSRPRAFTLVELLVAMVLTLILVTAIAQFYAIIGDTVKDGRAMIEVSGRVRAAVNRLNEDLENITVQVAPWTDDGSDGGYFEYFEGAGNDYDFNADGNIDATYDGNSNGTPDFLENGITTSLGDGDDFLAFTIRSVNRPLTGRYTGALGGTPSIYSSEYAEVIWWVGWDDLPFPGNVANQLDYNEPRYLYRRQLLIRPDLVTIDASATYSSSAAAETKMRQLWQENDISLSVRYNASSSQYYIAPNSLADLSRREYRFAHTPLSMNGSTDSTSPHVQKLLPSPSLKTATLATSYVLQAPNGNAGESPGEDVMLSNLLAFDVQVYDPNARIWQNTTNVVPVLPGEPGYTAIPTSSMIYSNLVGLGAFVDLYYYRFLSSGVKTADTTLSLAPPSGSNYPKPLFADQPNNFSTIGTVYDTWALSYERDGINQDGDTSSGGSPLIDEATNGADDDGNGLVDDVGERETKPPYADPIRGIRIRIRVYEPSTRQVRQATVATDFITE